MGDLAFGLAMLATVVFAITGVLAAVPQRVDIFGATVLGVITAIGGGTLRDVTVDAPVFWIADNRYLWVALVAALGAFALHRLLERRYRLLLYLDALGIALFGVQAADKVLGLGHGPRVAVTMGLLTGIGGGLIRDLLAGRPTLILSRELYATPILLGVALYVVLHALAVTPPPVNGLVAIGVIVALRAAALRWGWHMPTALTLKAGGGG